MGNKKSRRKNIPTTSYEFYKEQIPDSFELKKKLFFFTIFYLYASLKNPFYINFC